MDTYDEFEPDSAADAVALLVSFAGGRLNYTAALKLLYFAEREALVLSGASVTRGTFWAMEHGPVVREVYDLIKGNRKSEYWSQYLSTVNHDLVLRREPSINHLARIDVRLLQKHWNEHRGTFNPLEYPKALVDFSHTLPEWTQPGRGKWTTIPYRRVFEVHGKSEMADWLEDYANEERQLFGYSHAEGT